MKKSFKTLYKMRYLPLLLVPLLVVLMVLPGTLIAEATAPSLGDAISFSVLAHLSMSADGDPGTTTQGDLGLSSGLEASRTGLWAVGGNQYFGPSSSAFDANADALIAYNSLAGQGSNGVFNTVSPWSPVPGVYTAAENVTFAGTITLSGDYNDVWIFQVGNDMTFSGSVEMTGNAQACNVFWQIGRDASIGGSTTFVGTLIADRTITVGTSTTVSGRLLSLTSSLTFAGNNNVFFPPCSAAPAAASGGILTIYKVDSSGKPIVAYTPALAASFNIYANAADIGVNPPVQAGSIIKDTNFFRTNLPNGTFYVVETSAPEGYSRDSTVRTVTMSGGNATVTFINGPTGGAAASATETTTETATTTTAEIAAAETVAETTTTTPVPVTTTVTGRQIPKTGTPWYNVLLAGIILILIGAVVWITRKVYEKRSKT